MSSMPLSPISRLQGTLAIPGDKSISHRYALLGGLAQGTTAVTHLAPGADVASSLACVAALGAAVDRDESGAVRIDGWGQRGPVQPDAPLDCGNSGTTMRLLLGILAAYPITATLIGDRSLSRRPMRRVTVPLTAMGASFDTRDGAPPVTCRGGSLRGLAWTPEAASAQIKSAIMLAAIGAGGTTTVIEPAPTRDHTERAFPLFGLACHTDGVRVTVAGGQQAVAPGVPLRVPGDPSSAAVWAAAAAALPGSRVRLTGVSLNPRRLGFVEALRRMGASIRLHPSEPGVGEPVGDLEVTWGERQDTEIAGAEVPSLIDELPVLAASAAHGCRLEVRDADELRVKESDRIAAVVTGLSRLGVAVEERPDGFIVDGRRRRPTGGEVEAADDHRLVMAFAVVALGATGPTVIHGAEAVSISYPAFATDLQSLSA
jgi:3-phosphoshikimate 1-carboxyvinyltransferase